MTNASASVTSARRRGAKPLNLGPDSSDSGRQVVHHLLGSEPQHVIAGSSERAVSAVVGRLPPCMIRAVDFDDEAHFGSEQVGDEPPEQRHLPAKRDAEAPAADGFEQARFGRRGSMAHVRRPLGEQASMLRAGVA